jgi:phosphonate transport system substrate-binding protein
VAQSGAHQNSITQILNGEADASAVDSTVLDLLFERDATLRDRLRVIDVMGPSPIPPYVIGMHVAPALRHALRHALTHMHQDPAGAAILQRGQMARFVAVTDADYNRTREMIRIAARCEFVDSYAASL